jgi:hypothetical protein
MSQPGLPLSDVPQTGVLDSDIQSGQRAAAALRPRSGRHHGDERAPVGYGVDAVSEYGAEPSGGPPPSGRGEGYPGELDAGYSGARPSSRHRDELTAEYGQAPGGGYSGSRRSGEHRAAGYGEDPAATHREADNGGFDAPTGVYREADSGGYGTPAGAYREADSGGYDDAPTGLYREPDSGGYDAPTGVYREADSGGYDAPTGVYREADGGGYGATAGAYREADSGGYGTPAGAYREADSGGYGAPPGAYREADSGGRHSEGSHRRGPEGERPYSGGDRYGQEPTGPYPEGGLEYHRDRTAAYSHAGYEDEPTGVYHGDLLDEGFEDEPRGRYDEPGSRSRQPAAEYPGDSRDSDYPTGPSGPDYLAPTGPRDYPARDADYPSARPYVASRSGGIAEEDAPRSRRRRDDDPAPESFPYGPPPSEREVRGRAR